MTTLMRVLAATLVGLVGLTPPARAAVVDERVTADEQGSPKDAPQAPVPTGPPAGRLQPAVPPPGPAVGGPGPPAGVAWCVSAGARCPLPAGTPRGQTCWCPGVSQ
jgi:hypothetical protein